MDSRPDAASLIEHLGRPVLAAAEATGRVDTDTDAVDALGLLLAGQRTAEQLLTDLPGLEPIRAEFLQFAQRLEAFLNQPAG